MSGRKPEHGRQCLASPQRRPFVAGDASRVSDVPISSGSGGASPIPSAALVVAVFIFKVAFDLIRLGLGELLERSLPDETEQEILGIVTADPEVGEPHNLQTHRIGAAIAVEVHVRVDGAMSVARSHELTVDIERRLRARFGQGTIISIHVEPVKCPAEARNPGRRPAFLPLTAPENVSPVRDFPYYSAFFFADN